MTAIADQAQREQALDPRQSFIVQAPAGSGKTELLIRRFLVLLAHVENRPEEILAITFTRKAATEMHSRIIQALTAAAYEDAPTDAYKKTTWELARQALAQNEKAAWNLLQNPNRLRIQTIDSFCHSLIRQMPLLSELGAQITLSEQADVLYITAARELLKTLEEDVPWADALARLLLHLDNHHELVEHLFVEMLSRRDQWLPHVIANQVDVEKLRLFFEQALQRILLENLKKCFSLFPQEHASELMDLISFAANYLWQNSANDNTIIHCKNLQTLPEPILSNQQAWLGIAHLLLTKEFQWRLRIDKNLGFSLQAKTEKIRMLALLEKLKSEEIFRQALQDLVESPPIHYTQSQWQIIEALLVVLPILVAQLKILFNQKGMADFTELSLAALQALSDDESPTDIALYLDYQIRHILIDEFQDTSITQFKLLEKLIAGWQPDDGRSLFLVGDTMQSIYRFREAEVGLFLKTQQEGIGNIQLKPLTLQVNFRSTRKIVNWINEQFQDIFPQQSDITLGAVTYTPSLSMQEVSDSDIQIHALAANEESDKIISIINDARKANPNERICILVRSRSHLHNLIPALSTAGLKFSAVEIENLARQSIVRDLSALTRALLHLADRIAWLALLRAPWCGLKLADIHAIAGTQHQLTIWQCLMDEQKIANLSENGKQRLARVIPILKHCLFNRKRQKLPQWIETTWHALNGPACIHHPQDLNYAEAFFELLEKIQNEDMPITPDFLEEKLNRLRVSSENQAETTLQIMTIHKAKGLEFDTVIIPSLERKPPPDRNHLLMWLNRPRKQGDNDLILAPIKSRTEESNLIYNYLRLVEKKKKRYELSRLLYVAMTRAKKNLHLIATAKPAKESLLELLWPKLNSDFEPKFTAAEKIELHEPLYNQSLRRFKLEHRSIPPAELFSYSQLQLQSIDNMPRLLGIIIHRCLQEIAQDNSPPWNEQKLFSLHSHWKNLLLKAGVTHENIASNLEKIHTAISNTLSDPKGRWILDTHLDAQNEFALTAVVNNDVKHFILDRIFIDAATQIRWIIDYKTTDISLLHTLSLEKYQKQLREYAMAMKLMESREICVGLYFPFSCEWLEVTINPST